MKTINNQLAGASLALLVTSIAVQAAPRTGAAKAGGGTASRTGSTRTLPTTPPAGGTAGLSVSKTVNSLPGGKPEQTGGGFHGRQPGTGSKMSEQQLANLKNLQNDLLGIKADSQVTQEQKDALAYSLMAMADGATKPSQASVDQLSSDLSEAMADGTLANREKIMLANDLASVMNSANIPQSEVDQAIAAAQTILTASGISKADVQKIVTDLKTIAAEGQKNAAAAKATADAKAGAAQTNTAATGTGSATKLRGKLKR